MHFVVFGVPIVCHRQDKCVTVTKGRVCVLLHVSRLDPWTMLAVPLDCSITDGRVRGGMTQRLLQAVGRQRERERERERERGTERMRETERERERDRGRENERERVQCHSDLSGYRYQCSDIN